MYGSSNCFPKQQYSADEIWDFDRSVSHMKHSRKHETSLLYSVVEAEENYRRLVCLNHTFCIDVAISLHLNEQQQKSCEFFVIRRSTC